MYKGLTTNKGRAFPGQFGSESVTTQPAFSTPDLHVRVGKSGWKRNFKESMPFGFKFLRLYR